MDKTTFDSDRNDCLEYDRWFREQVQDAMDDPRPSISHAEMKAVMAEKRAQLLAREKQGSGS